MKWEYVALHVPFDQRDNDINLLNLYGAEGWELATERVYNGTNIYLLKRGVEKELTELVEGAYGPPAAVGTPLGNAIMVYDSLTGFLSIVRAEEKEVAEYHTKQFPRHIYFYANLYLTM